MSAEPRTLLREIFGAAVMAANPRRFVADETARLRGRRQQSSGGRGPAALWVLAVGKAAHAMAAGAVDGLGPDAARLAGGLIVAPEGATLPPHAALVVMLGDHPVPAAHSIAAANRLGEVAGRVGDADEVLVLLSGGASSLVGAPADDGRASPADLAALHAVLLGSGLAIDDVNAVRRRFSRWGAGRLAAALAPARVWPMFLSDVPGDHPDVIGSGPVSPDPFTAGDVRALLLRHGLWPQLPAALQDWLERVIRGELPETPKRGAPAFARVEAPVVMDHRAAVEGAAQRARELGVSAVHAPEDRPLTGEAGAAGAAIAAAAAGRAAGCLILGGETTVTLHTAAAAGAGEALGGRCQELALAAALDLERTAARGVTILAAGTDGRDGPTAAAGAIVDAGTCAAIRRAGRDPARDLARHDSHRALDAAGALLRTGLTGTNVMDLVVVLST